MPKHPRASASRAYWTLFEWVAFVAFKSRPWAAIANTHKVALRRAACTRALAKARAAAFARARTKPALHPTGAKPATYARALCEESLPEEARFRQWGSRLDRLKPGHSFGDRTHNRTARTHMPWPLSPPTLLRFDDALLHATLGAHTSLLHAC
eukprot:3332620-Pleurochrysis_carterae.AAC.4